MRLAECAWSGSTTSAARATTAASGREGPNMTKRTLMITMNADLRVALRAAGKRATAHSYQDEVLNFETAASSPIVAGR